MSAETETQISTFLPVSDHDFQNGQRTQTGTLYDCLTQRGQSVNSPFNECILLIAMCARTLVQAQRSNKQQRLVYNPAECERPEWQQWLDHVLSLRLQTLAQDYPSLTDSSDPMLHFANFLAQATVVYLCKEVRSIVEGLNNGSGGGVRSAGSQSLVADYQRRAYAAVGRTVELARSLADFPVSKVRSSPATCQPRVGAPRASARQKRLPISATNMLPPQIHPLTPIPLFLSIEFLTLNNTNPIDTPLLHNLLDALRQLMDVNNAQQSYLELFDYPGYTIGGAASSI